MFIDILLKFGRNAQRILPYHLFEVSSRRLLNNFELKLLFVVFCRFNLTPRTDSVQIFVTHVCRCRPICRPLMLTKHGLSLSWGARRILIKATFLRNFICIDSNIWSSQMSHFMSRRALCTCFQPKANLWVIFLQTSLRTHSFIRVLPILFKVWSALLASVKRMRINTSFTHSKVEIGQLSFAWSIIVPSKNLPAHFALNLPISFNYLLVNQRCGHSSWQLVYIFGMFFQLLSAHISLLVFIAPVLSVK